MKSYKLIACEKYDEFLNIITPWNSSYDLSKFVFRGLSNDQYELLPNSFRDKTHKSLSDIARITINNNHKYADAMKLIGYGNLGTQHASYEFHILRRFYKKANSHGLYVPRSKFMSHSMERDYIGLEPLLRLYGYETWLERDLLEIASLAQHYGLPTRLIDWSYNPYTAAFFASNNIKKKKDGLISLWMVNIDSLSDVFEANFSDVKIYNPHYQWNDNARSQFGLFTYKVLKINKEILSLQSELMSKVLKNKEALHQDEYKVLLTDYETFDQSVVRLTSAYNNLKIKEINIKDVMIKITLPHTEVDKLNKSLRKINISESSIFPGYNGIVNELNNKLSIR